PVHKASPGDSLKKLYSTTGYAFLFFRSSRKFYHHPQLSKVSLITIMLRAKRPQELVMKLSGHKDVRSFMKYVRMTEEDAAEAVRDVFG
ncbi:MAG: hypothetical protein J5I53_09045, partial [Bradyrhizobiaceae bacterium]|nr:hypothetical protein [Bradyrhizobiaceae bacterium]